MDTRVGMVFKPDTNGHVRYLNSIRFKLRNTAALNREKDNLEIKVYNMVGKTIANEPANINPIYVRLDQLKKYNEVKVSEPIEIPDDGILVVLELPNIYNDNRELRMTFAMSINNEDCNLYEGKVTNRVWNSETFPAHAHCFSIPDWVPGGGKYEQLNIGITYSW